jgi:O-antigen ligase
MAISRQLIRPSAVSSSILPESLPMSFGPGIPMISRRFIPDAFSVVFVISIMLFSPSKAFLAFASLPEILIFAFLFLFFLKLTPKQAKIKKSPYYGLLLVFALIMAAGLVKAYFSGEYGLEGFKHLFRLFEYLAIFFLTIHLVTDKAEVKKVLGSCLLMGILVGSNAVLQKVQGPKVTAALQPWGPEWVEQYTPSTFRVYSFFDNPIYLGIFAVMWLGLTGTLLYHYSQKMTERLLLALLSLLALATLILTGSRAALAGAIAVILIIIFIRFSLKKALPVFLLAAVLSFFLPKIAPLVRGYYSHHETNITQRYLAYRSAIHMIKDNLLLGIGAGNYREIYYRDYRLPAASDDPVTFTAENNFLEIAAQTGIFGLLVYISFFWLCFKNLYFVRKNTADEYVRSLALGIGISLTGLLVASFFATVNTVPLNMILWLFFGLAQTLKNTALA